MARIRGSDTKPELLVRRLVRDLGFRYRINMKGLPGRPDIALIGSAKLIFVHGCFWHQHGSCALSRVPKSRTEFWNQKFEANKTRDEAQLANLRELGWDVLIIWECETRDPGLLFPKLLDFLAA